MMICSCVTTNAHLKAWIASNGRAQRCDSCGVSERPAVQDATLVAHIDRVFRQHYTPCLDDPEHGEDVTDLIRRHARLNPELAAQVAHHGKRPDRRIFYQGPLERKIRILGEYSSCWRSLTQTVKFRAQFCGAEMHRILDRLLGDMRTFCGEAAIRRLMPGEIIFRARKASSREEALEWFRAKDDSNIRAPDQSPANRMNAAGIRAFYGALQDRIAIAEKMQPSIGGHIVVGSFVPTRPLTVLDLGALGGEFEYADLFDPEFDGVSERLVFLRMLEQEISLPIQPAEDPEDPIGYVPTQIVAEYVHGVLSLDGLAYRSTQTGEAPSQGQLFGPRLGPTERNVVLFGGAALTTEEAGPEGVQAGLRLLPEPRQLVNVPADQHP